MKKKSTNFSIQSFNKKKPRQGSNLSESGTKEALDEGEHEHVEEARRHAGGGPEVRQGAEGEGDARRSEGGARRPRQGAPVDDVAALHDGAGQPHPDSHEELPRPFPPRTHRRRRRSGHRRPRPWTSGGRELLAEEGGEGGGGLGPESDSNDCNGRRHGGPTASTRLLGTNNNFITSESEILPKMGYLLMKFSL